MSKTTKRKHVTKEIEENYDLPTDSQEIVKVVCGRGNNLHEVQTTTGERYLASMPSKFRKNVWMKRGCYVIVEPIEEGNKVKAEIVHILLKDHIKYIQSEGKWPEAFKDGDAASGQSSDEEGDATRDHRESGSESSDFDLPANPNRPNIVFEESDSESSTSDDEVDDESEDDESPSQSTDSQYDRTVVKKLSKD